MAPRRSLTSRPARFGGGLVLGLLVGVPSALAVRGAIAPAAPAPPQDGAMALAAGPEGGGPVSRAIAPAGAPAPQGATARASPSPMTATATATRPAATTGPRRELPGAGRLRGEIDFPLDQRRADFSTVNVYAMRLAEGAAPDLERLAREGRSKHVLSFDASYGFSDLEAGRYAVGLAYEGALPESAEVVEVGPEGAVLDLRFRPLERREVIAVTVRDPSGRPMRGVSAKLRVEPYCREGNGEFCIVRPGCAAPGRRPSRRAGGST